MVQPENENMMRKITLLALMAIILQVSCSKHEPQAPDNNQELPSDQPVTPPQEEPVDTLVDKIFTVSNIQTKTFVDGSFTDDGKVVIKWMANDSISVWDGYQIREFAMASEPLGPHTLFKGKVHEDATVFWAYYPYTDDFTARIPAIQYANPAGGVADGSVYAAGMADPSDNIEFDVIPSFLSVTLDADEAVTSVSIEGHDEDDFLSGTISLSQEPDGIVQKTIRRDGTEGRKVTLCNEDGSPLAPGVTHYILLPENRFEKGYTVKYLHSDGSETEKSTAASLDFVSQMVYEIQDDAALESQGDDYYQMYIEGNDITIAGQTYNKSTYGNATLIKSDETMKISSNGVYFIEEGAEVEFTASASLSKLIIVGRMSGKRSEMIQKIHFKMATDGVLAVMNLDVDNQLGSNYLFNIYGTNVPKRFALDNCSYQFTNKHFMYQAKTNWPDEVLMHNCDIEFTQTAADLWLFNINTAAPSVSLMDFTNNLFWHSGTFAAGKAFRITNGSSITIAKAIFKNNTFINLPTRSNSSTYFSAKTTNAEVTGNIFHCTAQPLNGEFMQQESANPSISGNISYTGNDYVFAFDEDDSTEILSESPFSAMDLTKGEFIKKQQYLKYGAQRDE